MTVKQLRGWHPDWEWRPVKRGMSWFYYGSKDDRYVSVEPFATMWDDGNDYPDPEWWVDEAGNKIRYEMWAVENMETA